MGKVRINISEEEIIEVMTRIMKKSNQFNLALETTIMKIDEVLERLQVLDEVMEGRYEKVENNSES